MQKTNQLIAHQIGQDYGLVKIQDTHWNYEFIENMNKNFRYWPEISMTLEFVLTVTRPDSCEVQGPRSQGH